MIRHLPRRPSGALVYPEWSVLCVVLVSLSAEPAVADDPPGPEARAMQTLVERRLTRIGSTFVLPEERELRRRLDALETLVARNQETIQRRWLRGVARGGTMSLLADLQAWRFTMHTLAASTPGASGFVSGLGGPINFSPFTDRGVFFQEQYASYTQQVQNLYLVLAGTILENQYEAAQMLSRQDEFQRARAALSKAAADLTTRYQTLKADPAIPAALGTVVRSENRPLSIGPLEDYAARLDAMNQAMEKTRVVTNARGKSAPDYSVAVTLIDGLKRDLRLALGRIEDHRRKAARGQPTLSAAQRADLERQIAQLQARYARSVRLLRAAYDAQDLKPAVGPQPLPARVETPRVGQIRQLVEQNNARLRADYVADAEKSLNVERVPLTETRQGFTVPVVLNGGITVAMRVEPWTELVEIPSALGMKLGLSSTGPATTTLRTVKVGSTTLNSVACRVTRDGSDSARIGLSFLEPFVAEIDTQSEPPALVLTRVNLSPILPRPLPKGAPPPKIKR